MLDGTELLVISPLAQITLTCETLQQQVYDRAHQKLMERLNNAKENQPRTIEL